MKYKKLDWVEKFDIDYYKSIADDNNKLWFNPREDDTSEYVTVISTDGKKVGVVSLTSLSEEKCYYLQAIVSDIFMINLPLEIHTLNECSIIYMVINRSQKRKIKLLNSIGFKTKRNVENLDNRIIEENEVVMIKSF